MSDRSIAGFFGSLISRAFERETLVTLASLYLIATGRVTTMEEAVATIGTVTTLVLGRSWVKARAP